MMFFKGYWIVMLVALISGCVTHEELGKEERMTQQEEGLVLRDLAFDHDGKEGYRIQIEEDGNLESYLVLTDDYNGNCLLLREYLLDEPMRYNHAKLYSAYYEDSDIDSYLSGEFLERFSESFLDQIEDSTIVITAKESLGIGGEVTTTIMRKVFLLSYTELGKKLRTYLQEGERLSYFSDIDSRIACYKNGKPEAWWLRTPSIASYDIAGGVGSNGVAGGSPIIGPLPIGPYKSGVRPAFCLKGDIPIVKQDGHYILAD